MYYCYSLFYRVPRTLPVNTTDIFNNYIFLVSEHCPLYSVKKKIIIIIKRDVCILRQKGGEAPSHSS
jgi:hypothetical protein